MDGAVRTAPSMLLPFTDGTMFGKSLRSAPLLLLGTATPLLAQEAEGGGLLSPSGGLIFWTTLSFLIVLGVLWKLALPPILAAVEAREQQIRDLLSEATRDREQAQEVLAQQQRTLDETRARVQEMVAEGRQAGEQMREDIVQDARRQATELMERARRDVQYELERALQELRTEAVDLALAAAGKLIDRNLDEEDNRRLVRSYLEQIESRDSAVSAGV